MPLSQEQKIQLIKAYEPILYFHKDEKFTPVKPEVYMQNSALWCSQPGGPESRHDKNNWDACEGEVEGFPREPLLEKGAISVNPIDDGTNDSDGDGVNEWYLGHQADDGLMPFVISNDERSLWLDNAAWQDSDGVTATSLNEEVNVERAVDRWNNEPPLQDAADWYYAEVEELDKLSNLVALIREEDGIDLREVFGNAYVIWYYFLYPLHQENTRLCSETLGASAHGNYEGDWNAVGVFVRQEATFPWESAEFPAPEFIGYGQRGRGLIEDNIPFFRQQMDVRTWVGGEVRRVDTHAKVFVAEGSHNNYSIPGPKDPPALDLSDSACGTVDEVEEELRDRIDDLEDTLESVKDVAVLIAKVAIGGAIGGPFGALVGAIAGAIEAAVSGGDDDSDPIDDEVREELEDDDPPEPDDYGVILTPSSLAGSLPDASFATEVRPWQGSPEDHLVNRELQIWWPGTSQDRIGYEGRWGVMCQNDPRDRRSGIEFPNFKRAFLLDLAIFQSAED